MFTSTKRGFTLAGWSGGLVVRVVGVGCHCDGWAGGEGSRGVTVMGGLVVRVVGVSL